MWMNDWGWEDRQLFLAERRMEKARRKLLRERTVYQIVAVCVLYVLYRMVSA